MFLKPDGPIPKPGTLACSAWSRLLTAEERCSTLYISLLSIQGNLTRLGPEDTWQTWRANLTATWFQVNWDEADPHVELEAIQVKLKDTQAELDELKNSHAALQETLRIERHAHKNLREQSEGLPRKRARRSSSKSRSPSRKPSTTAGPRTHQPKEPRGPDDRTRR
jgi:hypothetical protein